MTVEITAGQGMAPLHFSVRVGEAVANIVLADDGQAFFLGVGERFLLYLGEDYTWELDIANPAIVSRVPGVLTIRGSQGLFEARQAGSTALLARGDPLCLTAQPPCKAPSRVFYVTLDVH